MIRAHFTPTFYFLDDVSVYQQHIDEAMKEGKVMCNINVAVLMGIAGAGKTHVKYLLLDEKPPITCSTPLAEEPVKIRVVSLTKAKKADRGLWNKVTSKQFTEMLICEIKNKIRLRELRNRSGPSAVSLAAADSADHISFADVPMETGGRPGPLEDEHSSELQEDFEQEHTPELDQQPLNLGAEDLHISEQEDLHISELEKELLDLVNVSEETLGSIEVDWVYLIDSGGQPQFQELLQVFVKDLSVALCVTKLNEKLSDHPERPYTDRSGKRYDKNSKSPLNNEDIIKRYCQALQSHKSATGEEGPGVFIIGTHMDQEHNCSETRDEKNEKLYPLLRPMFGNKLGLYSRREVIFPVNALMSGRGGHEMEVARDLRDKIEKKCSKKRVPIPLPYFVFEIFLGKLAEKKGVKILSLRECEEVWAMFKRDPTECFSALKFLAKHNVLFYDPVHLPGVVFVNSQVLLSMITALVYLSYVLETGGVENLARQCVGKEWDKFCELGMLSAELLESDAFEKILLSEKFEVSYRPGIFTADDFLHLLKGLHVISPVEEGKYIMPCLLPELPCTEGDNHRNLDPEYPVLPLILRYKDRLLPAGVFTLLVAWLQNDAGWELVLTRSLEPECHYFNCTTFERKQVLETCSECTVYVTLLHYFEYLEVHVESPVAESCCPTCPKIVEDIMDGLEKVSGILGYTSLEPPEKEFFCPQRPGDACEKEDRHPAINEGDKKWKCTRYRRIHGELGKNRKVWLNGRSYSRTIIVYSASIYSLFAFSVLCSKPFTTGSTSIVTIRK